MTAPSFPPSSLSGVVINLLTDLPTNALLFHEMAEVGLHADRFPIISFAIHDTDAAQIGPAVLDGHYAAFPYFTNMSRPQVRGVGDHINYRGF